MLFSSLKYSRILKIGAQIKIKRFSLVFLQSDDASAVQDVAESPVDTDPADVTEVRPTCPHRPC